MLHVDTFSFPAPVPRPLRLAHLTDLHLPDPEADDAVDLALRFHPDLVVLTGDYVGYGRRALPALTALLRRVPVPMVAVLGNHDHWAGADEVTAALTAADVRVLRNEACDVDGVVIAGVDDGVTGHDDVAGTLAHAPAAVVLSHTPRLAPAIWARGGRLVLSGHTHGGHFDLGKVTDTFLPYVAGVQGDDAGRVYTCPGIGGASFRTRAGRRSRRTVGWLELQPASTRTPSS